MKTTRIRFLLPLMMLMGFLFAACNGRDTLVDTYQELDNLKWTYIDKIRIPVKVEDASVGYVFYLNIRHTGDYKYSNIFVLIRQLNPDGTKFSERKEFTLALPDGMWLGTGSGSLLDHQIPFRKGYHFPEKGTYIIELEQNMRDNPLRELSDIGLRIEKASN